MQSMPEMSILDLVSNASVVVQAVMLVLLLASVLSWYVIVQRHLLLAQQEKLFNRFVKNFRASAQPEQLYPATEAVQAGVLNLFNHGVEEYQQFAQDQTLPASEVMDAVERRLLSSIADEEEKLEQHLSFLATVGSVSPYIGLFGTVWGIMNSFIGLSQVQQATLNTVAPGIAEALIATAIGLFSAIPAVIAYNRLSSRSEKMSARYYSFANELQTRLYRRLSQRQNVSA